MRFERAILDRLNRYPNDFVGAFKQLSKNTYKIFTHAYQSYLFNQILTEKIKANDLQGTAPLIGYETEESELVNKILEKEELSIQDFRVKPFPEASTRGTDRSILAEIKISGHSQENSTIKAKFSLEKGAYATIFLREVMKN
jgi:tRNA pseudouridine13 synthase